MIKHRRRLRVPRLRPREILLALRHCSRHSATWDSGRDCRRRRGVADGGVGARHGRQKVKYRRHNPDSVDSMGESFPAGNLFFGFSSTSSCNGFVTY